MLAFSGRIGLLVMMAAGIPAMIWGCSGNGEGESASAATASSNSSGGGGNNGCIAPDKCPVECENGATTSISGTVYEPAGNVPLYNIKVFIPSTPLPDIPDGASCDLCSAGAPGNPVVEAITDTKGQFVLNNVPVGKDIPLVIQTGKWQRQFLLPEVTACVDNPTIDTEIRLPRNKSEGHLPKIALTTGGADSLECFLRKVGIDDAEFTLESGDGRVNLFAGNGGSDRYAGGNQFTAAATFWDTLDSIMRYDVVLLSCEGAQNPGEKPQNARQALFDYASAGGRIFASHWHNIWIEQGPDPWPSLGVWNFLPDPPQPYTSYVDTSFPKGSALQDWLINVGASTTPGELIIEGPQHTLDSIDSTRATRWIYGNMQDQPAPSTKYFTFNTPLSMPDDQRCGRFVYSDIHVSSGDNPGQPWPDGCTTNGLSPQEKALLFMLFDISGCVAPDQPPPE